MKADYNIARKFLEEIKPYDRVGIISHDDLDGFASGILFYHYCVSRGVQNIKHVTFSYGKTKPSKMNLEDRTKFLIADISPSFLLEEISHFNTPTLYTDHHQSEGQKFKDNVLELRTLNQGYIPSSRTVYELCGGKRWWGLLGVWSDTLGNTERYPENKEFINTGLEEIGLSETKFRKLWLNVGNFLIYYAKDYERAFDFLVKIKDIKDLRKLARFSIEIEKEIHKAYMQAMQKPELIGGTRFSYVESPFEIKSAVINKISTKKKKEIFVLASPKPDGQVSVSARSQEGIYNVDKLLKMACQGIPESRPGGHKSAAGAVFKRTNLEKFKKNLANIDIEKIKQ